MNDELQFEEIDLHPKEISFWVEGIPAPQPRTKARAVRGGGGKVWAQLYNPPDADEWKAKVFEAARAAYAGTPHEGAVEIEFIFKLPRPLYHFKGTTAVLKPSAPSRHIVKPDFDNLSKAAADAITSAGIWKDDCQASDAIIRKRYAELSGCQITIKFL